MIETQDLDRQLKSLGIVGIEECRKVANYLSTEWARIDNDMNVVFLDMDKCAEGPHNHYTVLAITVWNAAIEAAAERVESDMHNYAEVIRRLKK